jgi:ribosomal protein S27E
MSAVAETHATREPTCPICAATIPVPWEPDVVVFEDDVFHATCPQCSAPLEIHVESIVRYWTKIYSKQPSADPQPENCITTG